MTDRAALGKDRDESPSPLILLDLSAQTLTCEGTFGSLISRDQSLSALVDRLSGAARMARADKVPIVWVFPSGEFITARTGRVAVDADHRPDPRLGEILSTDRVVLKTDISAFDGGGLDEVLVDLGSTTVTLAGVATQYVVLATALQALERGLAVIIRNDLCADLTLDDHTRAIAVARKAGAWIT